MGAQFQNWPLQQTPSPFGEPRARTRPPNWQGAQKHLSFKTGQKLSLVSKRGLCQFGTQRIHVYRSKDGMKSGFIVF